VDESGATRGPPNAWPAKRDGKPPHPGACARGSAIPTGSCQIALKHLVDRDLVPSQVIKGWTSDSSDRAHPNSPGVLAEIPHL